MCDRSFDARLPHRGTLHAGARAAVLTALVLLFSAAQALPVAAHAAMEQAQAGGCSVAMSPEAASAWADLDGAEGRLGCPTAAETATIPSIRGTASRVVAFGERGAIVLPLAGPAAGKGVTVFGCAFVLWTQLGGPGGRLGLPLADANNTPDGWLQRFEAGQVITTRAYDSCDVQD